jgi:hypothetical protein
MASKCPPGVICIENMTLLLATIMVIGAVWFAYRSFRIQEPIETRSVGSMLPPSIPTACGTCPVTRAAPACSTTNRSGDVYLNPYAPPLRDGWACGQPSPPGVPINIRTRGVDVAYRQVGILTREGGEEQILPLMGRPLEPRRDKWNFYTMAGNQAQVKLPVRSNGKNCTSEYGCDDLTTGDIVTVEGYKSSFKVTMYENESPRYLPCVI